MGEIITALDYSDRETSEPALKYTIRRLYLALICHVVGSVLFKSPVLSFCAVLSRKVNRKGRGSVWSVYPIHPVAHLYQQTYLKRAATRSNSTTRI